MLFHVRMDVHIPLDMPKQMKLRPLKRLIHKIYNEMASHLAYYRPVFKYQYFESNEELHNILQGLPLYP